MLILTDLINDIISFISLVMDQPFFFVLGFHHPRIDWLLLRHIGVDALCCGAGSDPRGRGGRAEAVVITAGTHEVSPRLSTVFGGNEWPSLPAKGKAIN